MQTLVAMWSKEATKKAAPPAEVRGTSHRTVAAVAATTEKRTPVPSRNRYRDFRQSLVEQKLLKPEPELDFAALGFGDSSSGASASGSGSASASASASAVSESESVCRGTAQLTLRRFLIRYGSKRGPDRGSGSDRSGRPPHLRGKGSSSRPKLQSADPYPRKKSSRRGDSENEFVTPIPMKKRATIAGEWRTPVITPYDSRTQARKRNLVSDDSLDLKRPCWRVIEHNSLNQKPAPRAKARDSDG